MLGEASRILELQQKWNVADKDTITDNIEKYLIRKYPACRNLEIKLEKLMEITGSKKETVYAWVNRGRQDVKIPFLKLCMVAEYLNVSMDLFFE